METNLETLLSEHKKGKIKYSEVDPDVDLKRGKSLEISFPKLEVVEQQPFIEFLKDGWFMNMAVAIDFTASNGALHDLKNGQNDYETAIKSIGKILEPYAYEKLFMGFGFGGIPRYQGK